MKKVLITLVIIVSMVLPAWNMGCSGGSSGPELPAIYGSKTMSGMKFKYPVEWKDVTNKIGLVGTSEEVWAVANSADSVVLGVSAIEHDVNITHEEAELFTDFLDIYLSGDYEVIAREDTIVGGQPGWELEIEGKFGWVSGEGYILTFYRENITFMIMWIARSSHKEKMLPVYEKVKGSISFGEENPAGSEDTPAVQPTTGPTFTDLPTPSDMGGIEYESYSLEGVRFNYPAGWRWGKSELIVGAGAMWGDPTNSAILMGTVTVWPELVEEEGMEEYAIAYGDEMVAFIMDKYDTVISNKEIEVNGEWALEMEINGRIGGRKYVGYILSTFHQTTQFSIVFFVDEINWDELGGIYDEVKNSIEFGGGWTKRFGGKFEDSGKMVLQTSDGGYGVVGMTESYGAGKSDVWLVKTNPRGFKEWDRAFGGAERDNGNSMRETSDGGYIIVGCTESYGDGEKDLWLIKTNSMGFKAWDKTLGGGAQDCGWSVEQTSDGGYITGGVTESFGTGTNDAWLVKFDSIGEVVWEKTFGLDGSDEARSVQQTEDGGYIITGQTSLIEEGISKVWLIKTDSEGNTQWEQTFGKGNGNAVIQLDDGGYCITGSSLLRTDWEGVVIWETPLGQNGMDEGTSVQQTSDGNLIVTGHIREYSGNAFNCSVWLTKFDEMGEVIFASNYGGTKCDLAYSGQQTNDGGYIITGSTETYGVSGSDDLWLIKTDSEGKSE